MPQNGGKMKSTVYFTKVITPEKVLELYKVLGKELTGNGARFGGRWGKQMPEQSSAWNCQYLRILYGNMSLLMHWL